MTQILESPTTTLRTWQWCQEAFAAHGIKLSFPKNTNPQKTYQWRYVTRLTHKIDEWGLDKPTAKAFISFAVGYVKEQRLLHKGLSVFFQNNMMDICYNRMKSHSSLSHDRIKHLWSSHKFVLARCGHKTTVCALLGRESFGKMHNVVRWHKSGDVSRVYLAASIACTEALEELATISPSERDLLPSRSELYCLLVDLSKDDSFRSQAKVTLENDWRTLCQH
jgi:hypothetical protein